jgi:hypothetical protein
MALTMNVLLAVFWQETSLHKALPVLHLRRSNPHKLYAHIGTYAERIAYTILACRLLIVRPCQCCTCAASTRMWQLPLRARALPAHSYLDVSSDEKIILQSLETCAIKSKPYTKENTSLGTKSLMSVWCGSG